MEDARSLAILQMAVALLTSSNPLYNTRDLAGVTSEILGSAQGIDVVFGIEPPETEQ